MEAAALGANHRGVIATSRAYRQDREGASRASPPRVSKPSQRLGPVVAGGRLGPLGGGVLGEWRRAVDTTPSDAQLSAARCEFRRRQGDRRADGLGTTRAAHD